MMGGTKVKVGGQSLPVRRTSLHHFKTVTFKMCGRDYQAIQQNPEEPSAGANSPVPGIGSRSSRM